MFRRTGKIAIAGLAAVAALSLAACGSDDGGDDTPTTTTTSATAQATTTQAENTPAVPSVADLNAQLQRALDPAVPNEEKLDMVQGVEADPELPGRLAQAYTDTGATIEVTDVTAYGNVVNAKAKVVLNGQENIVDVPFVAEDGKWKVQKDWACQMLTAFGQQSVACTA
ncbi:hypothetical protein IU433_20635 [Nocardia puris]|uniref:Low molecular weight antigen MTB12-like C-terminal domain-containing protein n=1 Tax=Nocardia puris TaxID=208602 RepID=A0A366E1T1_9NOCA|nr:hypothetical protein [Nocardia puris]MBF6212847.1 hypothetical protein [Nocardia puris]MBF6367781.1 hypothetical protein [Nocardia puris]MBF6461433.1 hypothetical protein [Nocardia puris]RBO96326.1 hypothetical protein DFR74_101337 [Nocardia puris]